MLTIKDISSTSWNPLGFEYFNTDREFETLDSSAIDYFPHANILEGIEDIKVSEKTLIYLTKPTNLTEKLSNINGSLGFPLSSHYIEYDNCLNDKRDLNVSLDEPFINSQYLYFSPIENRTETDLLFNFLELKNVVVSENIYTNNPETRNYSSLSFGNNQYRNRNELSLSYETDKDFITFSTKKQKEFKYGSLETKPISSCGLIEDGAVGGSSPLNSDIIWQNRFGYDCEKNPITTENGTYLCSWLSASEGLCNNIDYEWVDRWVDINYDFEGKNYIEAIADISSTKLFWDVPSKVQLIPSEDYIYERFNKKKNDYNVEQLYDSTVFLLSSEYLSAFDSSVNKIPLISEDFFIYDDVFIFDGYYGIEVQNNTLLNSFNSYTLGTFVRKDNWCCGKNGQIFGNYYKGGKGIFYNTGNYSSIITIPTEDGLVYGLNQQFTKIYEKDVFNSSSMSSVTITETQTDNDMNRWIVDNENHFVYKIDVDDIITKSIQLQSNSYVSSMAINSYNEIYIQDINNRTIFVYDSNANPIRTISQEDKSLNYIHFDLYDNLIIEKAKKILIDKDNNIIKALGSSIYKNGIRFYPSGNGIEDILIDKNNNIWIVDKTNVLKVISSQGILLFTIETNNKYNSVLQKALISTNVYNENTSCESEQIWMFGNCSKTIMIFDLEGNQIDEVDLTTKLGKGNCFTSSDFVLTGDFSGYDINRKRNIVNNEYISSKNPTITAKFRMEGICGQDINIKLHYPACNFIDNEWYHIAITHDHTKKQFRLIINGEIVAEENLTIEYIPRNNLTTPYIIGGTSGKIGTENQERGLDKSYFVGEMIQTRFHNYALNKYDLLSLYNKISNNFYDMNWIIDTKDTNKIETINRFNLMNPTGSKSNKFNIIIKNSNITDEDLRYYIEEKIKKEIKNIKPANTELYSIVWK